MGAIKAESDSNAARGGADTEADRGEKANLGFSLMEADPEAVEFNSELSTTEEPEGAEQYGTSLNSYSFQADHMSAKSGMKIANESRNRK
jgi:hypothetical protein